MSEQPSRPTVGGPAEAANGQMSGRAPVSDAARPDMTRADPPTPPPANGSARRGSSPPPPPSAPPPKPGEVLRGRYRLETLIAVGGMAAVWRATDTVLTRPVAVKILLPKLAADPDFVARFRREAVAAARLAHPGIVATYDTCTGPEAIVMELVDGRTLRDELDQRRFLPPAEAVALTSQVAVALDAAHKAGVVHRDIKPGNVLLSAQGGVKVADFGIAKALGDEPDPDLPDLTNVGHMVGTAKYLAPEQVSGGEIDPRTDVYALGAVLYEMLCGRPPFDGDNALATATARLHGPPERPRSVLRTIPPALERIVMKAMSIDPADRYESTAAMWADLQAAPLDTETGAAGESITAEVAAASDKGSFARQERSGLVPVVAISLTAVALIVAWMLIGGSQVRNDVFGVFNGGSSNGGGAEVIDVAGAAAFDPIGSDGENNDLVGRTIDGDPETHWQTENYRDRDFGDLKDGVGIVVDLGEVRDLDRVVARVAGGGWSSEIYVADVAGATLEEWGRPAGSISGATAGDTAIDLGDARGSYVLFWITDLGENTGVRLELDELTVFAD